MSERRSSAPLILGVVLILVGALFLAANVYRFDILWLRWLRFLFPALLVLWGAIKLARHFNWDESRISRQPGRAGILGGLFWTSIGVVWILDLVDVVSGFDFFGLYWPLLLVLFGAFKILDYYRFKGRLQFRPAEIVGVLFLILCGVTSGFLADAHFPLVDFPVLFGDDDLRLGEIIGKRFEWSDAETVPAQGLETISISNLYGDVRVQMAAGQEIEVHLTKEVFDSDEESARQTADLVRLSISRDGAILNIGSNREDLRMEKSRFKSNLSLTVPANLSVQVTNGYGDVHISEIQGTVHVENSFGDVVVEDTRGDATIRNRHDRIVIRNLQGVLSAQNFRGSIDAEDIAGPADLQTEYDSITASRIQGNVSLTNRFGRVRVEEVKGSLELNGPGSQVSLSRIDGNVVAQHSHKALTMEKVGGSLEAASSYSKIRISEIGGSVHLNADHADIEAGDLPAGIRIEAKTSQVSLSRLAGPFYIATSLRDVSVREFSGSGEVLNEFGEVLLVPSAPLTENLSVTSRNGRITLKLPANSAFRISAQAPGGSIQSEFHEKDRVEAPLEEAPVLEGVFGSGGPQIRLQTTHAEIRLLRQ